MEFKEAVSESIRGVFKNRDSSASLNYRLNEKN